MELAVVGADGRDWVVRGYRNGRGPFRALAAMLSSRRWVEAVHEGPPRSRMSWMTDAEHEAAVIDQVARQLELGYDRITPHRASFLGFDR